MASLQADSVSKTFSMRDIGGWAGAVYMARVYQWRENKPYMLQEENQGFKDETQTDFVRTISERNDKGEMAISCEVEIREPENGPTEYCLIQGEWKPLEQDESFLKDVQKGSIIKMDGRDGACR
jgi:hypothetical protein